MLGLPCGGVPGMPLVTSVPPSIARPLIEGQRNETIVRDDTAAQLFSDVYPVGFDEAVTTAGSEAAGR
jgi:hypothetical protein